MDKIGSFLGQDVIHMPAARKIAFSSLRGSVQAKEGDDIAGVGVENLLIRSVRRGPDKFPLGGASEVFDMGYHG